MPLNLLLHRNQALKLGALLMLLASYLAIYYYWHWVGALWITLQLVLESGCRRWHHCLIIIGWLTGLLIDLTIGSCLGLSGCWLLLQLFVAKTLLTKTTSFRLLWLLISSLAWLIWLQQTGSWLFIP